MRLDSVPSSAFRAACRDHGHDREYDRIPCDPRLYRDLFHYAPCRGAFDPRSRSRSLMKNRTRIHRSIRQRLSVYGRCSTLVWLCQLEIFIKNDSPHVPLELFLPRPSLSTTSSAHCTDRPLALCRPRRRSILGAASVGFCDVLATVVVWEADGVGALRCDVSCDMISASGFF